MSDNIPFDIQMEIIKKVAHVKSLIRFRSISKSWKSFIDSFDFIKGYGVHHTQPRSHILSLYPRICDEVRYICLVEDDIKTFKVQQQEFVMSPLLKQYHLSLVVGASHGLLCLFCYYEDRFKDIVVIWNPSIGKSVGIDVFPNDYSIFGFGVCPVTSDPTVVKFVYPDNMPWHVEVFTLSSGVWNVIPSANLPRQSIQLSSSTYVVIDRFIYWGASEITFTDDGESTTNHMVVSFDMITKEFKVVDLPDTLTNKVVLYVSVSKLNGSLVVYGSINVPLAYYCRCGVWVMEHDSSFRKLFTIGARVEKILGFMENGETIFETPEGDGSFTTLNVYNPGSQQIKNLEIYGASDRFFMGSYKESLLLLDHSDLHIQSEDN